MNPTNSPANKNASIAETTEAMQTAKHSMHIVPAPVVYVNVRELCAIRNPGEVLVGHYDNEADFKTYAEELNAQGYSIYSAINRFDPSRFTINQPPAPGSRVGAEDVIRRVCLPIDVDSIRPKDESATDDEKASALAVSSRIKTDLAARGIVPTLVDSGNGYQIRVPIDLPNDEESGALVEAVIRQIKSKFEVPGVKIDVLADAPRIFREPGYVNHKGKNTTERPNRRAQLIHQSNGVVATPELLKSMAGTIRPAIAKTTAGLIVDSEAIARSKADVEKLFERAEESFPGWTRAKSPYNSRADVTESLCPNSDDHGNVHAGDSTTSVLLMKNGAKVFKCWHASCEGSVEWQHFRELMEAKAPKPEVGRPAKEYLSTDSGNAQRLMAEYGANYRFLTDENKWLHYDGRVWKRDQNAIYSDTRNLTLALFDRAMELKRVGADEKRAKDALAFAMRSDSANGRLNMVSMAKFEPEVAVKLDTFDQDPTLLNVQNGTLDLRQHTFREHRRADMMSRICPVRFEPGALCPRWLEFLKQTFVDRPEVIPFIQRSIGYSLTGLTSEQCFWLLIGMGRNGKSVLLNVIEFLLGDYAAATSFDTFMVKRKDSAVSPRDGLASLYGARFVRASEGEEVRKFAEATIKNLTGGEQVRTAEMYKKDFSYRPTYKIFLSTNHEPTITGTDDGIWRRIKRINFEHQVPADKVIRDLDKILEGEGSGILNWALAGLKDYQQNGLQEPVTITAATQQYRAQQNPIRDFLEDRTIADPQAEIPARELLERFNQWARGHQRGQMTDVLLGRAMRTAGHSPVQRGHEKVRTYVGMKWREQPGISVGW